MDFSALGYIFGLMRWMIIILFFVAIGAIGSCTYMMLR